MSVIGESIVINKRIRTVLILINLFTSYIYQDLPVQGPIIINVQTSYQPGERVLLNCTSSPSNPMAVLHWSLDGEKVSSNQNLRVT